MNNKEFQQLLNELGSRVFCITLNNNHKIFVNMTGDKDNPTAKNHVPLTQDFQFKTVGNDDLFGVPRVSKTWGRKEIPYTTWVRTALVEIVMAVDKEDETDIPDIQGIF